jgi:FAD/FMN-containing dehydrogenase
VDTERNKQWSDEFFRAMQPFSMNSAYTNYLGEETHERVKEVYGSNKYERLVAIKNRYDPTNLFRINQNIKPTISEAQDVSERE